MTSSRRRFIKSSVPALLMAGNACASAKEPQPHDPAHEEQAKAGASAKARMATASELADQFLGTQRREFDQKLPKNRVTVAGSIYGLAATIENAAGTPVAVACLKSPNSKREHVPALWAWSTRRRNHIAEASELSTSKTAAVWNLSGKIVWFDIPKEGARNIGAEDIVHPWQAESNVPLLNAIRTDVASKTLKELGDPAICSAIIMLDQGRLETGVPWSYGGRNALYHWKYESNQERLPGRPVPMSDNQIWTFALPEGQTSVDVKYRNFDDPETEEKLLTTLFVDDIADEGITFFLSNDVKPGTTQAALVPDSIYYWRATTHATIDLRPTIARSVTGIPNKLDPSAPINNCDTNCQRSRIRLRA